MNMFFKFLLLFQFFLFYQHISIQLLYLFIKSVYLVAVIV